MSAEYDAALEVCGAMRNIEQSLDLINSEMPKIRERIATAALQGIIANVSWNTLALSSSGIKEGEAPKVAAYIAVRYADALIKALDTQEST